MTYEIKPRVTRCTRFSNEGGALAVVQVTFGPIQVDAKLYKNDSGYFLSWPHRKSEASGSWYPLVHVNDSILSRQAMVQAVAEYERAERAEKALALTP